MKYYKLFAVLILFIIAIGNYNCANIIPPGGGEKDKLPPQLLMATPDLGATNFKSKKIIIEFDEFFNLDNPLQNVVISPPMLIMPEFTIIGKKLIINFKEPLQQNVTYNINFGDAIKDFNEGNILKNFTYVFATGSILDTFQLSGAVLYAADNSPADAVIVGLYKSLDDSVVFNSKPYYFAKTDKNGYYKINNIHEGTYKIVALKDENLDYIYNNNENIGFNNNIVFDSSHTIQSTDLKIFKEGQSNTKLIDVVNAEVGLIKFIYNKPIKNFKFDAAIYKPTDYAFINATKDTISYYYAAYQTKNTIFYITTNSNIQDTVSKELYYLKDNELNNYKIKFKTLIGNSKISNAKEDIKHDIFNDYSINFNKPILVFNKELVEVYEDTVLLNAEKYQLAVDQKDKTRVILKYAFHSNRNYKIVFKRAAILDNWELFNDELTKSFITNNDENYGSIIINNVISSNKNYLLKITDVSNTIIYSNWIKSSDTNKKIQIKNLPSGTYKVIVIEDDNNNNKWDTGNYLLKIQAEKIYSINSNLGLKPGWDAEVDIKL